MHDDANFRYITKGKIIQLTKYQNEILKILIENKGHVVSHEKLCERVFFTYCDVIYKNILFQHICRLRKKLKGEVVIITHRQKGYMIV